LGFKTITLALRAKFEVQKWSNEKAREVDIQS